MKKEKAKELLRKYRLGQCTKEELKLIEKWYRSFDEVEVNLPRAENENDLKKQMYIKIMEGIKDRESASRTADNQTKRLNYVRPAYYYWRGIAAVLLIGLLLAAYFSMKTASESTREMAVKEVEESIEELLPTTIYLSDGSIVKLKGDSHLEYPVIFKEDTREVVLTGEAFFEVAKDQDRPFIIHAGSLTTKVLGTSFNIKAYENDESLEIAVVTGKVSVMVNEDNDHPGKELVLIQNQKAIYTKNDKVLVQAEEEAKQNYNAVVRSKLIFNETPFEEIVKVLNTYYKVNIKIGDESMKNCLITAELTDEPLEVSLMILTRAIGAEYEIKENEIRLTGRGCGFTE